MLRSYLRQNCKSALEWENHIQNFNFGMYIIRYTVKITFYGSAEVYRWIYSLKLSFMSTCGLLGSLACKLAGCQLQANKVVNSVDGDQLIWYSAFFQKQGSTWRQERIMLLSLSSNTDTFYTTLFEMYVTNKTNTV